MPSRIVQMALEVDEEAAACIAALFEYLKRDHRKLKYRNERLNWDDYVERLQYTGEFETNHRMTLESFNRLLKF